MNQNHLIKMFAILVIGMMFNIEWVKVRPRYIKNRGLLVDGEIVDETERFIDILEKYCIPYEEENGAVIIYRYRKL